MTDRLGRSHPLMYHTTHPSDPEPPVCAPHRYQDLKAGGGPSKISSTRPPRAASAPSFCLLPNSVWQHKENKRCFFCFFFYLLLLFLSLKSERKSRHCGPNCPEACVTATVSRLLLSNCSSPAGGTIHLPSRRAAQRPGV